MNEINGFLKLLGLEEIEVEIYISLLQNGSSTILEISKRLSVNRTSLYRMCEKLVEEGFLRRLSDAKTTKYEAASLEFLETKILNLEQKAERIKRQYKSVKSIYKKIAKVNRNKIKVIHYTGREEVKQLLWNTLDAKQEILSLGYRTLSEAVGQVFMDRWWSKIVEKKIRNIIIASRETFRIKDKAENPAIKNRRMNEKNRIWEPRVISKSIMDILEETFIYNDVFSIIHWEGDDVFGIEIHNKAVAEQEREIFKLLWKTAKPY